MNHAEKQKIEELYRLLARKTHPDINQHKDAASDFAEASSAYNDKSLVRLVLLARKYKLEGY